VAPVLSHSERIVDLTPSEEDSAAMTLLQLGLRVTGLTLPQDPSATRLPQQTYDVDEHTMLYPAREGADRTAPERSQGNREAITDEQRQGHRGQRPLSQYFSSLAAENPIQSTPSSTNASIPQTGSNVLIGDIAHYYAPAY
jgi:hypothetical protein